MNFQKSLMPVFVILFLILSSGCGSSDLPRYSVLQGLRVAALTLDQPEINFDGATFTPSTVNLSPWVSDLYGNGRSLSMNVYICLDPGIGSGLSPSCATNAISSGTLSQVLQAQAVSNTASFLAPNYTGQLNVIPVSLAPLATTLQAAIAKNTFTFSGASIYNGYAILVFFEIYSTTDPTQKVTTFKRLIFTGSSKTTKNQNPAGLLVRLNGTEITSFPGTDSNLEAYIPPTQAEAYAEMDALGNLIPKTEVLQNTWLITGPQDVPCSNKKECTSDGYLALTFTSIGQLNPYYAPLVAKPTTRGRVLISVTRDNRGGEVVHRYCDGVCP